MSYPYPQDRHRDRKEKGDQPYQDAKEALSQSSANLQAEAEAYGEERRNETEEERNERLTEEAEERLRRVGDEVGRRGHDEPVERTEQH